MTEPGKGPDSSAGGPTQDVKDKFRDALERKKQANAGHGEGTAGNSGKVHSAHGAESHRKEFRRKSGG